ncbi:hypothetical protein BDW02DRAFT_550291 [Decorospora gaudefroyi]|uniref:DUF7730 domain-containing protein n=1 Tax=Decorospora gaudefroyi TaxID=184978 RepID=A0A6A5KAZ4_9PLEO|nr:hypothetical protein BDW02DRAFT_550291 [Decorospora gaudefroyi]
MVKKITYSKRYNDKRPVPYDRESAHEDDASRKRTKVDDGIEERGLPSPPLGRQGKKSLLKKGLYGGPVSIPDDDMDMDSVPKRRSVFDKVLAEGRHQAAKPDNNSIRNNREEFTDLMKRGQESGQENGRKRNSYLPTPPAEAERKAHQQARRDETYSHSNGFPPNGGLKALKTPNGPTETSQFVERVVKNEQPKPPYEPKSYKAEETAAPRRTVGGHRLSRKSKEARLWSMNQTNSPLLQLPENVRSLIYKYALGGKTINIGFETYRTIYSPQKPRQAQQVIPIFKYNCTVFNSFTNPFKATALPYLKWSTSFTLLNNICRQLYEETATLPYKLNLISFGSHNIMINFLLMERRLSRQQLDAITQLVLPNALPESNMRGYLRNLDRVFLAFDQNGLPKSWYCIIRDEGEEPKVARTLK